MQNRVLASFFSAPPCLCVYSTRLRRRDTEGGETQSDRLRFLLLHRAVGSRLQRLGKRPGRTGVEIEPDIESSIQFAGFADAQFHADAAAGPLRIRRARLYAVEFQHTARAGFEIRDGIAQFLRERHPVWERTS